MSVETNTTEHACVGCDKMISLYFNFCTWECQIEHAKRNGGVVHTPNGLPIQCIKADYSMLEHSHGDHFDYKFPVTADYVGGNPKDKFYYVSSDSDRIEMDEDELEAAQHQEHALIWTDGCFAVTLYECTYALWDLRDGVLVFGHLEEAGEWRLDEASMVKIRDYVAARLESR